MQPVDWALTREGLSAPKQLLLVALAWMTDEDGVTFKAQAVIAGRVGKDPRWVREHLPTLAAEGHVSRFRRHRQDGSRTTDLIVLNLPREHPLDLSSYSGILGDLEVGDREPSGGFSPGGLPAKTRRPSGENPPPVNQPLEKTPVERERASAPESVTDPRMKAPADFADVLRPHAREVYRVLCSVAEQHHAKKVWPLAVGRVVMAHPRHPLVATAHALAAWAVDPDRPVKDVVSTYRTFLGRRSELAATEFLAADGTPGQVNGNGRLPDGVTPIRRDRAAEREARSADRQERFARAMAAREQQQAEDPA
jgi:hypothetical protein